MLVRCAMIFATWLAGLSFARIIPSFPLHLYHCGGQVGAIPWPCSRGCASTRNSTTVGWRHLRTSCAAVVVAVHKRARQRVAALHRLDARGGIQVLQVQTSSGGTASRSRRGCRRRRALYGGRWYPWSEHGHKPAAGACGKLPVPCSGFQTAVWKAATTRERGRKSRSRRRRSDLSARR